jgi:hypothetical protein
MRGREKGGREREKGLKREIESETNNEISREREREVVYVGEKERIYTRREGDIEGVGGRERVSECERGERNKKSRDQK